MINPHARIISLIIFVSLLCFIIELVRRGRLKENYSLFWIVTSVALIIFSVFANHIIKGISVIVVIYEPANAFFVALFGGIILILLHFSVIIPDLSRRNKRLIQQFSILKKKVTELEKNNPKSCE